MPIKSLEIAGLRGFGKPQTVKFALPKGEPGSGLTFIVGANNSGKTTIFEAIRSFVPTYNAPAFAVGKRNQNYQGGRVHLRMEYDNNNDWISIDTDSRNGCNTQIIKNGQVVDTRALEPRIAILQSRRYVDFYFQSNSGGGGRYHYLSNQIGNSPNRSAHLTGFEMRIGEMYRNKDKFDPLLKEILGYDQNWTIDMTERGDKYIKFFKGKQHHSGEGIGDGIWSIFTICDSLYDSKPGEMIVIDEPELSLHPAYQKRVLSLFKRYAKDRQIVICTHSSHLIDMFSLTKGAELCRTVKNENGEIEVYQLSDESKRKIKGYLDNYFNPHIWGNTAKELFFVEDGVIVVEGQDDVMLYQKAAEQLGIALKGEFFGWGAGGAQNIPDILGILKDLGYKRVAVIYDGDMKDKKEENEIKFSDYQFFIIPTKDIRDKKAVKAREATCGMMTERGELKPEYQHQMSELLHELNDCL